MSNLYRLMDAQMGSLKPFVGRTLPCIVFCAASLPKSRGKPRVDNRPVLCGIISINRNGLRWRDAPRDYGPAKTLYTRWKPWSDTGVFARIRMGLAAESATHKSIMMDATYLKAHRRASGLSVKKWGAGVRQGGPRAA